MTQVYLSGSQHTALLGSCDRCHAPAVERVELATGELLFCGHHHKQYQEALERGKVVMKQWIVANDETHQWWPLTFDGDDEGTALELAYNFSGFVGTRAYIGDSAPDNYELWITA